MADKNGALEEEFPFRLAGVSKKRALWGLYINILEGQNMKLNRL